MVVIPNSASLAKSAYHPSNLRHGLALASWRFSCKAYFFVGAILTPKLNLGVKLAEKLESICRLIQRNARRQALACVRLAQTAASLQTRLQYAHLAKILLTLAGDLDDLHAAKV